MIKKLWFPQQPLRVPRLRDGFAGKLMLLSASLCCTRARVAMGMAGQALPGGNAEKLSAPLPCPALLCLVTGSASCSCLLVPAPESSFLAPSPGTDFPPAGISVSNPFFLSFPQHLVLPQMGSFCFGFFQSSVPSEGCHTASSLLLNQLWVSPLSSPSPSCFSLYALTGSTGTC